MQLALTILAGFGALLFIICFLGYVLAGFKHHFVTGLISLLPVLNVVTLPSLWDKNSRNFIVGFIGLIIFIGSWFLGADKGIQNLVSRDGNSAAEEVVISSAPKTTSSTNQSNSTSLVSPIKTQHKKNYSYNESDMFELPTKALYKMGFDIVPINQISTLQGRIVQITKNNNELLEGRVKSIAPGSIVLDGAFVNELPIASIKQLKLMVKKANQ